MVLGFDEVTLRDAPLPTMPVPYDASRDVATPPTPQPTATVTATPDASVPPKDAGIDAPTDAPTDVLPPPVDPGGDASDGGQNPDDEDRECWRHRDHHRRDDNRVVTFPGEGPPAYEPKCLVIRVGQSVTWQGDFALYPLEPSSQPSPIAPTSVGVSATFTFGEPGRYRYVSTNNRAMTGTVLVRPMRDDH
jgi:plastocyanin